LECKKAFSLQQKGFEMISVVSPHKGHPVQNIYMSKIHSLRAFF